MPFIELKSPSDFIRIKPSGTITVSVTLYRKFFNGKKVRIFHDQENNKIGLQPSNEGYKINTQRRGSRFFCNRLSKITTGEFYPKWSEKHKMLVFSYG